VKVRRITTAMIAGLALIGLTACSGTGGAAPAMPNGATSSTPAGPGGRAAYLGKYMVMVRYQSGENAKEFTEGRESLTRLHQAVSSVHGLADQAYFASAGSGRRETNTLAAREGPIAVFLTAPKPLASERSLMHRLLGKL
jgi:hypothetical protein